MDLGGIRVPPAVGVMLLATTSICRNGSVSVYLIIGFDPCYFRFSAVNLPSMEVSLMKKLLSLLFAVLLVSCSGGGGGGGGEATNGAAPVVTTLAATSVGATTAILNGNVTANGLATNVWFEWGPNSSLSAFISTAYQSAGSGTTNLSVNTPLTGLSTGTTYYYRVAANNSSGTTKGFILAIYGEGGGGGPSSPPSKVVYWAPPKSFSDGTPLVPSRDLQGYEIYVKQDLPFVPVDNPVATPSFLESAFSLGQIIPPLSQGVTYYVSLRTVTVEGMKSDFSPPVSFSP